MLFRKKKKKERFSEEDFEQIITEYTGLMKDAMGKYLPRRMRRAMNKNNKGWESLSVSEKKAQIQEIKQKGLNNWLDESTGEVLEQVSSFVSETVVLEEELRKILKEFKKKWNIK